MVISCDDLEDFVETGRPLHAGGLIPNWLSRAELSGWAYADRSIHSSELSKFLLRPGAKWRNLLLHGLVFVGPLDLDHAEIGFPLRFHGCHFLDEFVLDNARIREFSMAECGLHSTFSAEGSKIEGDFFIGESVGRGLISLRGTRVTGDVLLASSQLLGKNVSGRLDGAEIDGDLYLTELSTVGSIDAAGARIHGSVRLVKSNLGVDESTRTRWSFTGDHIDVGRDFHAAKLRAAGPVGLMDAKIGGQLLAPEASFRGESVSLCMDRARVVGGIALIGAYFRRTLRLAGVHSTGQVVLDGATLDDQKCGLSADGIRADTGLSMVGVISRGELRFIAGHVGGEFRLTDSFLAGSGDAFSGDRLRVSGSMFIRDSLFQGTLRLPGAHIEGQLVIQRAKFTDASVGILAGRIRVNQATQILDVSSVGSIDFSSAVVIGQFALVGVEAAPVFRGVGMSVHDQLIVRSTGRVSINLAMAELRVLAVAGLEEDLFALHPNVSAGWELGSVAGVVEKDAAVVNRWVSEMDSAQPAHELAAAMDRRSEVGAARRLRYLTEVGVTKRSGSRMEKVVRYGSRFTTGFGLYPWISLVWIAAVFSVALVLARSESDNFTTASTVVIREQIQRDSVLSDPPPGRPTASEWNSGWDVPRFSSWSYAVSIAVPASDLGTANVWVPPTGWVSAVFQLLRLAAWVFTALILAAVAGLLRRRNA